MVNQGEHYYIQPHPMHKRGYQIMRGIHGEEARPVGEYIVMDKNEDNYVTEQKIIAIQDSLNRKEFSKDFKKPDNQHVSFQRVKAEHEDHVPEQIIFYNNFKGEHGETHRQINAILTFAKGETQI